MHDTWQVYLVVPAFLTATTTITTLMASLLRLRTRLPIPYTRGVAAAVGKFFGGRHLAEGLVECDGHPAAPSCMAGAGYRSIGARDTAVQGAKRGDC